ncbi:hypothetical protein ACHQM5_002812 [Ranunculus cassubicifolius]
MDLSLKKRKVEENGGLTGELITGISPDDIRKILEPFTHEQLLEIVQSAALRHLDVLESIRSVADRDPAQRKLFIRGLGWDTTTEGLRNLFSAYGDLEEAVVILDKTTGKSKGYGFITFRHIDGAMLALKEPSKKIDGRMTVTQLAAAGVSGGGAVNTPSVDVSARKIYVGNVPADMPADRLLAHFLAYGEIEEGPLGFDKQTGKSRGFALFVYKNADFARASLVDPIKTIDGHQMTCKLAIDGKKMKLGGQPGGQGEMIGDGVGMQPPTSMPNSLGSQYAIPGGMGPGGLSNYGGYPNQIPAGMGHHHIPSIGAAGLPSGGNQGPSSLGVGGGYGVGLGNPYGLGGGPSGFGTGSSLYRLPPGSVGLPSSGYPEAGHYGLSSGFPGQLHQQSASSPATRVPPGGLYQNMPPFY